jgi:hypothetical protein
MERAALPIWAISETEHEKAASDMAVSLFVLNYVRW